MLLAHHDHDHFHRLLLRNRGCFSRGKHGRYTFSGSEVTRRRLVALEPGGVVFWIVGKLGNYEVNSRGLTCARPYPMT